VALDVVRWLADLPRAEEEVTLDLVFDGWLIQEAAASIRIVTGGLCLTFATADVLSIEVLGAASQASAQRARVSVRRGAPLLDARPRECMADHLPDGRRPFALSSRPLCIQTTTRVRFLEKEENFIRSNGLGRSGAT
jgi:hypothetical protein